MLNVSYEELVNNRERMIARQQEDWYNNQDGELKLNLGCGSLILPGYINIDFANPKADREGDLRHPEGFAEGTVGRIVCNHALEHIPMRDLIPTLKHWYKLLKPGGIIDIEMPDIELCMQTFLNADEKSKRGWNIWTIYGAQTEIPANGFYDIDEPYPYEIGQTHLSGISMGRMVQVLEGIGFRMIDTYQYEGYGTPSFFVYAQKPMETYLDVSALETDIAIGTFTNTTKYLNSLWTSANLYIPHIPFITRIAGGSIAENMALLRESFIESGKRYWAFLDHDIQFLSRDTIKNALSVLISNKCGAVTVYQKKSKLAITETYDSKGIESHLIEWLCGHLILVDSWKVGKIEIDNKLPTNGFVDISYSLDIRKSGYEMFIAPEYIYHVDKVSSGKEQEATTNDYEISNKYFHDKLGDFYDKFAKPINVTIE